jgi:predicted Ser/Thr protein kinase
VLSSAAEQSAPLATATAAMRVPTLEELAQVFPQLEILEFIGQGGMGFVLKARQPNLDRIVALKLLPESLAADPHFAERFNREARFLARLNHPNIVAVHDFGKAGGFYFLLMEYVDGLNLRQAMRAGRFSPDAALAIVPKICEALQYAHEQGVLHRDIKPENLLLDTKGRIKIADFGIAKLIGEEQAPVTLTGTGSSLGTPHYMAPEQLENPGQVDHRADIYSLGVVFYEMLTGELPIGRFAPPSSRATLDVRIDEIVLRALAKERELRQKDARELQTQVERISADGGKAGSRIGSGVEEAGRSAGAAFSRRKLAFWGLGIAALSVICTLLIGRFRPTTEKTASGDTNPLAGPDTASYYWDEGAETTGRDTNALAGLATASAENAAQAKAHDQAIALAREQYGTAKRRHENGEITDTELAAANRDLVVAEARGDAVKVAKAGLDFAEWRYHHVSTTPEVTEEMLWEVVEKINKATYAHNIARAGTNQLSKARADLKLTEMTWGLARAKSAKGAISNNELKETENQMLYARQYYDRLKAATPDGK